MGDDSLGADMARPEDGKGTIEAMSLGKGPLQGELSTEQPEGRLRSRPCRI